MEWVYRISINNMRGNTLLRVKAKHPERVSDATGWCGEDRNNRQLVLAARHANIRILKEFRRIKNCAPGSPLLQGLDPTDKGLHCNSYTELTSENSLLALTIPIPGPKNALRLGDWMCFIFRMIATKRTGSSITSRERYCWKSWSVNAIATGHTATQKHRQLSYT